MVNGILFYTSIHIIIYCSISVKVFLIYVTSPYREYQFSYTPPPPLILLRLYENIEDHMLEKWSQEPHSPWVRH